MLICDTCKSDKDIETCILPRNVEKKGIGFTNTTTVIENTSTDLCYTCREKIANQFTVVT